MKLYYILNLFKNLVIFIFFQNYIGSLLRNFRTKSEVRRGYQPADNYPLRCRLQENLPQKERVRNSDIRRLERDLPGGGARRLFLGRVPPGHSPGNHKKD